MLAGITMTLAEEFASAPAIIAMGGELKSSYCRMQGRQATLVQLGGDLEQSDVFHRYCQHTDAVLQGVVDCIAVDRHPDYLSTQRGRAGGRPVITVQHHHAHLAACLAEHGWPVATPVLGIALDGLGLGEDDRLWGGEFLRFDYAGFQRLATFQPVPLLGGSQAMKMPWRNTLAHLAADWPALHDEFADTGIVRFLQQQPLPVFFTMMQRGINAPLASSAGRLFDAVAASLDLHRQRIEFEGQAAMALEQQAATVFDEVTAHYPVELHQQDDGLLYVRWSAMWFALLRDMQQHCATAVIAARFHRTLIHAVVTLADRLCRQQGLTHVALSGGVFQNQLLRRGVSDGLHNQGLAVLMPQRTPLHDGGLALGQAVVAAARLRNTIGRNLNC